MAFECGDVDHLLSFKSVCRLCGICRNDVSSPKKAKRARVEKREFRVFPPRVLDVEPENDEWIIVLLKKVFMDRADLTLFDRSNPLTLCRSCHRFASRFRKWEEVAANPCVSANERRIASLKCDREFFLRPLFDWRAASSDSPICTACLVRKGDQSAPPTIVHERNAGRYCVEKLAIQIAALKSAGNKRRVVDDQVGNHVDLQESAQPAAEVDVDEGDGNEACANGDVGTQSGLQSVEPIRAASPANVAVVKTVTALTAAAAKSFELFSRESVDEDGAVDDDAEFLAGDNEAADEEDESEAAVNEVATCVGGTTLDDASCSSERSSAEKLRNSDESVNGNGCVVSVPEEIAVIGGFAEAGRSMSCADAVIVGPASTNTIVATPTSTSTLRSRSAFSGSNGKGTMTMLADSVPVRSVTLSLNEPCSQAFIARPAVNPFFSARTLINNIVRISTTSKSSSTKESVADVPGKAAVDSKAVADDEEQPMPASEEQVDVQTLSESDMMDMATQDGTTTTTTTVDHSICGTSAAAVPTGSEFAGADGGVDKDDVSAATAMGEVGTSPYLQRHTTVYASSLSKLKLAPSVCYWMGANRETMTVISAGSVGVRGNNVRQSRRRRASRDRFKCTCAQDGHDCDHRCVNRGTFCECDSSNCLHSACSNREFGSLLGNEEIHLTREKERVSPSVAAYEELGVELLAARSYCCGDKIILYIGVVVPSESDTRSLYMAMCNKNVRYDAARQGNAARYANSSHAPNAELEDWTVLGTEQIGLIALTDIAAGDAITWWYGRGYGQNIRCACGDESCGGSIGDAPKKKM